MKYIGKIFHNSWGYDMTINEFVMVISETPKTCIVQKIGKRELTGEGYTGTEVPEPRLRIGKPFRLKKDDKWARITKTNELALRGADKSGDVHDDVVTWTEWSGKPVYYNTMD